MWRIGWDMRKQDLDYDLLRRSVEQFRKIEPYLLGDYYPITPYWKDEKFWMAWQFDRPETGEGVMQVFRRSECESASTRLMLRGLDPDARYTVTNLDTERVDRMTGSQLMMGGLEVEIAQKPGAAILVYSKAK
jgi:alpha-galactosidase